jgi:hypothetical protein
VSCTSAADGDNAAHIPSVRFESDSRLTSYAGLVLFQRLFLDLDLLGRLRRCFAHLPTRRVFEHARVVLLLVVHLPLGWRRLGGAGLLREDPLVRRVVGLGALPSVPTVTRVLHDMDETAIDESRRLVGDLVLERLQRERLARVTLDFDGSVQSTKGLVEGTAVGFNRKKKGARSYWPLYCTVAQFACFLDMLHRPGNVNDSSGAREFMLAKVRSVRAAAPCRPIIESRMDGAFFARDLLGDLVGEGVSFTCAAPFERLAELKALVEGATWRRLNGRWSAAETSYLPMSWKGDPRLDGKVRFVLYRQKVRRQRKEVVPGPRQLDLFLPASDECAYKVVVTNRIGDDAATVLFFHNGRGSQEKTFGEANQHASLGVVATRVLRGNQMFTIAAMLANNLSRELQMRVEPPSPSRRLVRTRPALWPFHELGTLRQRLLHRAGRLVRPQGQDVLSLGANETT